IGEEQEINDVVQKLKPILEFLTKNGHISQTRLADMLNYNPAEEPDVKGVSDESILVYGTNGKLIRVRTTNQRKMVESLVENDILFAIGPAGTGKTYTAVAMAVRALKNKEIKRIILTRPAVEAGESLGFLPGDLKEKIDPYLRPLYDALDDMIQPDKLKTYLETRVIEVAPLAFMRGRTLDNAYVILDEAQNATDLQLRMFLTRMGPHAKMIITGDVTQIDLPRNQQSGLPRAADILNEIKGIEVVQLTMEDVVRHRLVRDIIKAYGEVKK
ncbi:MAG: PhoH family protein, partial [Bacteroidetes bacterium]|nr:PhoH family protein [Bacteroidota bacterium]